MYHPNGNKRFYLHYSNGTLNGPDSCWDQEEFLTFSGNYIKGRRDSSVYYFNPLPDNQYSRDYVISKYIEDEGLTAQQVKDYFDKPKVELLIVNNQKGQTKTRIEYYLNGSIKEESSYDDNGNSSTQKFNPDGTLLESQER